MTERCLRYKERCPVSFNRHIVTNSYSFWLLIFWKAFAVQFREFHGHVLYFETKLNLLQHKSLQELSPGPGPSLGQGLSTGQEPSPGQEPSRRRAPWSRGQSLASPRSGPAVPLPGPSHSELYIFGVFTFMHPYRYRARTDTTHILFQNPTTLVKYYSEGQVFSWIFITGTIMFLVQKNTSTIFQHLNLYYTDWTLL